MRAAVLVLLIFNVALAVLLKIASSIAPGKPAADTLNAHKIRIISSSGNPAESVPCMELGPFNGEEVLSVRHMLEEKSLKSQVSSLEMPLPAQWWVYIAPFSSYSAAMQEARQLQKMGIKGYPLFDENSPWKHAISFGVFKSEEAALRLLEELKRKGVDGARAEIRNVTRTLFYLQEASAEQVAQLAEIKAQFAGASLKQVSCPRSRNARAGAEN
ncbi:MAG: SPOR domain-containing protein [Burkholderiales bacterium]